MKKRYILIFEKAYKESMATGTVARMDAIVVALGEVSREIEKLLNANMSQKQMVAFSAEVKDFMEYFTDKYFDDGVNKELKARMEAGCNMPIVFHVYDQLMEVSNTQELEAAWAGARRDQKSDIKPFVDAIANAGVELTLELYYNGYSDELQFPACEPPPDDKHALETYLFRALKYGAIGLLWKWDETKQKSILSMLRTNGGKIFACGAADAEKVYYAMQKTGHIDEKETPPLFADFVVKNGQKRRAGSKNERGKKAKAPQDEKRIDTETEIISADKGANQEHRMKILPNDENVSDFHDGTATDSRALKSKRVKITVLKAGDGFASEDSDSDADSTEADRDDGEK